MMMMLSLFALLMAAQDPSAARARISIEEYLQLRDIVALQVAPEGGGVAFTVSETDLAASDDRTRLYLWRPDSGVRSITPQRESVSQPRWSPDGSWLAFLADGESAEEDGDAVSERQIWLLPIRAGGEALQLTRLPGGVLDYAWAPDGSTVHVLTRERRAAVLSALERRERERRDDAVVVRDGADRRREFWSVRVPEGTAEHVWGGDRGIAEMAVSPDGRHIAYATNYTGFPGDYSGFDLWLLDLENRDVRQLTDRPGAETAPRWSPDARQIVYRAPQNAGLPYSQTELYRIAASGGTARSLTAAFDRTILNHVWPPDGNLFFSAALGAYTHLFTVRPDGGLERLTSGDYNYGGFDVSPDGVAIYAVRESATEPPELWRLQGHDTDRLSRLNVMTEGWKVARQEVVQWTAPDGLAIEGLLIYPLEYEEGESYPLLVNPHGGPSSRVRDVLHQFHLYQMFAAHGYAVLAPNFRGSIGYGEVFGTANRQDLGGGDFIDLMAGVDHVIGLGVADPARVGIYGGSYGGYMTNWAITQTPRFRAAASMYGIFSLITDYSNSNIPAWEHDYLRAYYWEDLDSYLDRSPMRFVERVNTPVLIIHGADDANTFIANSNEMYRALRDLGRPVEFVKYPREGHGIREPRHRVDLFYRLLRWFDRHLEPGGAEGLDFYLVDEWVPGSAGWEMRVVETSSRRHYLGQSPPDGRYLEVTVALRPDTAAVASGTADRLDLDLSSDVRLIGPRDSLIAPLGSVIDVFGERTLMRGMLGSVQLAPPSGGTPAAAAVVLAFHVPDEAGEYHLRLEGFAPVRMWVPRARPDPGRPAAPAETVPPPG